jgi:aspartyl protease
LETKLKRKLLSLIFIVSGCTTTQLPGYSVIDTSCNICVVSGELNGKKTYFLIDTGAGITTLDLNQSKYFGFSYSISDVEVGGFSNSISNIKLAHDVQSITINGTKISDYPVYAENMSYLVQYIESCSFKRISGIIGLPLIKSQGLVIDLVNNKLYKQ